MDESSPSAVTASSPSSGEEMDVLTLRCWGTRGSIPAPGPETAGYGGNTPCLEIKCGEHRVVFDAGSGIRLLGHHLIQGSVPLHTTICLTHFHWDHIQGFPFFVPLYHPEANLRVIGPMQRNIDIKSLFAGQMGPIYFPVPFSAVAAKTSFDHLNEGSMGVGPMSVSAMRMRHPSYTVGYRIEAGNKQVCFIPDNELGGGDYPVGEDWHDELVEFIRGSDLLLHDAMYTEEEYPSKVNWGHSTLDQTMNLAAEAEVTKLLYYHHAPERSDAELRELVDQARETGAKRGYDLEIDAAREGFYFDI